MCGICGIYNFRTENPSTPPGWRQCRPASSTGARRRGRPCRRRPWASRCAASASSISPAALSPSPMRPAPSGPCSTARSTTSASCGAGWRHAGHVFRTQTDTEVIVHAYEEWGDDALGRLNGMFGLAIWDSRRRRLLLARDPFGVKPLYYHLDDRRLLFGSEDPRDSQRSQRVDRGVDVTALDHYLRFTFVPAPRTAFAGILKLRPGSKLVCDAAGATRRVSTPHSRRRCVRPRRPLRSRNSRPRRARGPPTARRRCARRSNAERRRGLIRDHSDHM